MNIHSSKALLASLSMLAALSSCGGGGGSTSSELVANGSKPLSGQPDSASPRSSIAELDTAELVNQISAAETPAGVDSELFAKLTAELIRVLEARGLERITASLPDPEKSRVADLAVSGDSSLATFTWSYSNPADYDQNGEVNIADLTPVGVHFGKDSNSPDWATASIADGDGNGLVNLADITPIGQNYLNRISGFELQLGDSAAATEWTLAADVDVSAGSVSSGRRSFSHELSSASEGFYRALPYENGNPRSLGEAGNVVQLIGADPTPGSNSQPDGGPGATQQIGTSAISGPPSVVFKQPYSLQYYAPEVGEDQQVYVISSQQEALKLDPDGNVLWSRPLPDEDYASKLISGDELLASSLDGSFHHFGSDGSIISQFSPLYRIANPDLSEAGLYLGTGNDGMHAYNADGSLNWSFEPAGRVVIQLAAAPNGNIYCASIDDLPSNQERTPRLHCLDPGGSELWHFDGVTQSSFTSAELGLAPDSQVYFNDSYATIHLLDASGTLLHSIEDLPMRSWDVGPSGKVAIGGGFNEFDSWWVYDLNGELFTGQTSPGDVTSIGLGQDDRVFWYDVFFGMKSAAGSGGGSGWELTQFGKVNGGGDASGNLYNGNGKLSRVSNTGEVLWEKGAPGDIRSGPVFTADGSFYLSMGTSLRGISANGDERWQQPVDGRINGGPVIRLDGSVVASESQSLTIDPDNFIFQDIGSVFAMSPSGSLLWKHEELDSQPMQPRNGSDGSIYFVVEHGGTVTDLVALNPDGSERWRHALAAQNYTDCEIAVMHGSPDRVYAAYKDLAGYMVLCLDADNNEIFSYPYVSETEEFNGQEQISVLPDGSSLTVYDEDLLRLDADGNLLWQLPDPGGNHGADIWIDAALLADGSIVASAFHDVLKLDKDGNELWRSEVTQTEESELMTSFTVDADGRIYGNTHAAMRVFSPAGELLWSEEVSDRKLNSAAAPAISPDGSIYLVYSGGKLLKLQ